MPTRSKLKDVIHQRGLTRRDQLLLCLSEPPTRPKSVAEVIDIAGKAGLRVTKSWNASHILSHSKSLVIRLTDGWELTAAGRTHASTLRSGATPPTQTVASDLRKLLPKLTNADVRAFVEEAIKCYEMMLYRAAVVLSWVGAMAVLYDHVLRHELAAFNTEAKRRDANWKIAKNSDDLARMKEYDFLQVAERISMLGKSVKGELEICLKLRNGCGHPNSLAIAQHRVASHVEVLVLNVYKKFV